MHDWSKCTLLGSLLVPPGLALCCQNLAAPQLFLDWCFTSSNWELAIQRWQESAEPEFHSRILAISGLLLHLNKQN